MVSALVSVLAASLAEELSALELLFCVAVLELELAEEESVALVDSVFFALVSSVLFFALVAESWSEGYSAAASVSA